MSRGDKVDYGGSPLRLDPSCVDNPEMLANAINEINAYVFEITGGGHIPSGTEVDSIPVTNPARRLVRFKLTEAMGNTTANQASAIAVDGAGADIADPTFTVVDSLQRYGSAGSGKYGWAMVTEHPTDTYPYEIISLGGEGTVTGSSDDELVKVTSNDAAAGYLFDQIDTWGGAPSYNASNHQPVWCDEQNDGGSETARFFTSKVSTTETYTVKCSATDTTQSYLWTAFSTASRETTEFDGDNHQRIYVRIDNATADETLSVYTKRSEDTGKVKCSEVDTLDYLNAQFADDGTYDEDRDILIRRDNTDDPSSDTKLYATEGKTLLARLTSSIAARTSSTTLPSGTASLYTSSGGSLSLALSSQTVYNPARSQCYVYDELFVPVTKIGDDWVLKTLELPQGTNWAPSTELHLVQCSSGTYPKFAVDAPLTDMRVDGVNLDAKNDCDGWVTKHTGTSC